MSKTPITVYLIRHGESNANIGKIFQKWEEQLSKKGMSQAKKLANFLKETNIQPDILLTSTAKRAIQTANVIKKHVSIPIVEQNDLFREIKSPSHIYGKPYSDKQAMVDYLDWYNHLTSGDDRQLWDTENYQSVLRRTKEAVSYLESIQGDEIIVVSHGFFIRALLIYILVGNHISPELFRHFFENLKTTNTGVSIMKYSKDFYGKYTWSISQYNATCHLK